VIRSRSGFVAAAVLWALAGLMLAWSAHSLAASSVDAASPRGGEGGVRIRGVVLDSLQRPIADAVVIAETGQTSVTRDDGAFDLEISPPPDMKPTRVSAFAQLHGRTWQGHSHVLPGVGDSSDPIEVTLASSSTCESGWVPSFGTNAMFNKDLWAMAVHDDGSGAGPALYVGGTFTSVGGMPANHVARWTGSAWEQVGAGLPSEVWALAVWDGGSGDRLYAGGYLSPVMEWNGQTWNPLLGGTTSSEGIRALVGVESPNPQLRGLYAGGVSSPVSNPIMRWSGTGWGPVGAGVNGSVNALAVTSDETGAQRLWAGGNFSIAGGVSAKAVASWDGTQWQAAGAGLEGNVLALLPCPFSSGQAHDLIAGGNFGLFAGSPQVNIARLSDGEWEALGGGANSSVWALAQATDGRGLPIVVAGGSFSSVGMTSALRMASWDGSSWSPMGSGIASDVISLASLDRLPGGSASVVAGGSNSGSAGYARRWDGTAWTTLAAGLDGPVLDAVQFDDESGSSLVVGGQFSQGGGVTLNNIGRWREGLWEPLGSGSNGVVTALLPLPNPPGGTSCLLAGGYFTSIGGVAASNIAIWDGSDWSPLGEGTDGPVESLVAMADGRVVVGGNFTSADGVAAMNVAMWNAGVWEPLGSGLPGPVQGMAVDDSGRHVLAVGRVVAIDGVIRDGASLWDGTSWIPLGNWSTVLGGVQLRTAVWVPAAVGLDSNWVIGGSFSIPQSDGTFATSIARWDGSGWRALGASLQGDVGDLELFDSPRGSGQTLWTGGLIWLASVPGAPGTAFWNGLEWESPGGSFTGFVDVLARFDGLASTGRSLVAAGAFFGESVGPPSPSGDSYLASWYACPEELLVPSQYPTISAAVDAAADGDVILIAAGTYAESFSIQGKQLTLRAADASCSAIITGEPGSEARAITLSGAAASGSVIEGIRFMSTPAGAVRVCASQVRLNACCFDANHAAEGGAVLAECGSQVLLQDCQFAANSAAVRGGALFFDRSSGTVDACIVDSSDAPTGGGLSAEFDSASQSLVIRNSTFDGNVAAVGMGGAISVEGEGSVSIAGTVVCNNSSPQLSLPSYVDLGGNTLCPCSADLNANGAVDGADLAILLAFWGPTGVFPAADIDASGVVDGADLAILLSGWGPCS
jgi:hypothetical protein